MNNKEHKSTYCSTCGSDTKEAHFVRNIKNRYGKYKGKLPFNCFNCGVRHFSTKCPYEKIESSDDEKYHNVNKRRKHHQNNIKQENHEKNKNSSNHTITLHSKGVNDSYHESRESSFDNDRRETLFITIKIKINDDK